MGPSRQPPPARPGTLPCARRAAQPLLPRLSGRSRAPAPRIAQASTSYSTGHEGKCLNRFSFLQKSALPAARCPPRCPPQPMLLKGCGHGTVTADAPKCPKPTCSGSPGDTACAQPCLQLAPADVPSSKTPPGPPRELPTPLHAAEPTPRKPLQRPLGGEQPKPTKDRLFKKLQHWENAEGGTAGAFKPGTRVTAHAKTCFGCLKLG